MEKKITEGQKVFFENELKPYVVMAVSKRYAVVIRKLNKKEDKSILDFKVETGAYCTKDEAWKDLKDCPVYSLIDFKENKRAADSFVFGVYDYLKPLDCLKAIIDLYDGKMELSKRNMTELNIDWSKTKLQ